MVSKRLLENREKGTVLDKTMHASIMKKEYNSIPLSHKPCIAWFVVAWFHSFMVSFKSCRMVSFFVCDFGL